MPAFWTSALGRTLAAALPDGVLHAAWSAKESIDDCGSATQLRRELEALALEDSTVRRWLMQAWRLHQSEVVRETERLAPEELAREWPRLARRHGHERLLLALLTEADEDTRESVELLFESLPRGREHKLLEARWKALQEVRSANSGLRLVIVGGDPGERVRIDSIVEHHGCRVTWMPAMKGKGFGPTHAALSNLTQADAVLIVTGRISHTLMHGARKAAERLGVPCRFVERLSERQIAQTLGALQTSPEGSSG